MRTLLFILAALLTMGAQAQKVERIEDADFAVLSKQQLFNAIDSAESGQSIYVADTLTLDLSDTLNIVIPGGVSLFSQGAHITYTRTFDDGTESGLFITGGDSVRIGCDQECNAGFTFTGYNCGADPIEIGGVRQASNAIRANHAFLTVRGNTFECWGKWAIDLRENKGHYITQNIIRNTQESGYGYGLWYRGTASPIDSSDVSVFTGNLCHNTRNCTDHGSQANASMIITRNTSRSAYGGHFDSHGGGQDTWIMYNQCLGRSPCARLNGPPAGIFYFVGNASTKWSNNSIIWYSGGASPDSSNVHVYGNTVGVGKGKYGVN